MVKNYFFKASVLFCCLFLANLAGAQVTTGASGNYGLRLINPSYAGNAIQVRRTCDNATLDVGFSCGILDTSTLLDFTVLSNELAGVTNTTATAFSLRKLSCTYAGKAINVRSSAVGSPTLDIGFTSSGDLDTASLLTFVGVNSGYVTKWYDQSGSTRDASQGTAANQPRIVNAGVIDRQGGKPSIFFNNTGAGGYSICLQTANLNIYTSKACFLGVAAVNSNLTYNCLVVKTNSNNYPSPFDFYYSNGSSTTTLLTGNGSSADFFTCSKNFNAGGGLNIWTYQANGTNASGVNGYYDASTQIITNQTATVFGDNSSPVCIGARSDGVTGLNGWISEVITFNSIPVAADIGYLNYTEGLYYGIAGPTFKSPSSAASLDAYISKWYDQSGNGIDASQATAADQPLIVSNGVINRQKAPATNFYPSIKFNGTSQFLTSSGFPKAFDNSGGGTLNMIAVNNAGSLQGIAQQGRNSTPYWGIWGSAAGKWDAIFSNGPGNMASATNSSTLESITLIQLPSTSTTLYGNGSSLVTSATTALSKNAQSFYIGYSNNAAEYWNGNGSEINVFSTGLSTTQRTLLETNQGAYYGLTPTNSKYTPANGYNLFVNGIGCATAFTDSVAGTRQSIGMGFVDVSFLAAGKYLTAGTKCPTASVSMLNLPAAANERWTNDWLLNITGVAAGNVQIYFDFSDYGVSAFGSPSTASNYMLLGRNSIATNFTVVPTTAVTIVGDRIIFTLPTANLTNGNYYTIGTADYGASPLPIELLNFTAIPDGEKVDIAWETATEINNAYFTVEKSKDGINYTKVIDVPGAGNSTTLRDYVETDYQPYNGTSYYRLKQTDKNGAFTYSSIIVPVNFNVQQNITVYPNPIDNKTSLNVKVFGFQNQEVIVVLRDAQGREFLSKVLLSVENNQVFIIDEMQSLAPGVYIVTASSNDKIYNYKLIVK